ncbi:hypothetical protein SRHO_G00191710 [Serrasalmus rhombeus]
MSVYIYILAAGIIAGVGVGGESESIKFPVKEVEECVQKGLEAGVKKICFTEGCRLKRTIDAVVPCFKLGYDLLYENSTYSLKGDKDVQYTAYCAIEKCVEGMVTNKQTGIMSSFQACLYGIKACVKKPRDEL